MKSNIITLVIGFSIGILCYHLASKTETIEKPIITVDSTSYWISASQIDSLKHLRASVDSFTVAAKRSNWRYFEKIVHDTVSKIDSIAGLSGAFKAEIWEKDTVLSRGLDTVDLKVAFTDYPYPSFGIRHKFNDDHVLVKEKVITQVFPEPKKMFTHGLSVGPMVGLINRKFDIGIGYTLTIHF